MDLIGYTMLSSGLGPEATARLLACLFTEIDRAALAVTQARRRQTSVPMPCPF